MTRMSGTTRDAVLRAGAAFGQPAGLYQRLGITTTSVWLMLIAVKGGPIPDR